MRFWDVSSLDMSPLYTVQTSKFFSGDHEPPEQIDGEDEGWPHLRKVGLYDPFCDDQRLGVQKIYFDAAEKILAVGGHGGQVIVLDINNEEKNIEIQVRKSGLKIYFTGPSDKMSGDVEFESDICPMTFSSVLTRK